MQWMENWWREEMCYRDLIWIVKFGTVKFGFGLGAVKTYSTCPDLILRFLWERERVGGITFGPLNTVILFYSTKAKSVKFYQTPALLCTNRNVRNVCGLHYFYTLKCVGSRVLKPLKPNLFPICPGDSAFTLTILLVFAMLQFSVYHFPFFPISFLELNPIWASDWLCLLLLVVGFCIFCLILLWIGCTCGRYTLF
jgi:hypothetical protein